MTCFLFTKNGLNHQAPVSHLYRCRKTGNHAWRRYWTNSTLHNWYPAVIPDRHGSFRPKAIAYRPRTPVRDQTEVFVSARGKNTRCNLSRGFRTAPLLLGTNVLESDLDERSHSSQLLRWKQKQLLVCTWGRSWWTLVSSTIIVVLITVDFSLWFMIFSHRPQSSLFWLPFLFSADFLHHSQSRHPTLGAQQKFVSF